MALETNSPTTADTGSVKEVPPPADSAAPPAPGAAPPASEQAPPAGDDVAPVAEQENLPAPPASSRDAYTAALADPAQYFADIDGLDGTFAYDLVDVDGDTKLELLLRAGTQGPAPVRVLQLVDGTLTATTDYLVDSADNTYPTVFTAGVQPGLTQYESDGTTLTATQFELHGNRLVKAFGPEETVVGNPLSGVTLIHWTPSTDSTQLTELDQPDPLTVPREGSMKQVSDIPELNGQSYRVQFGARHGEGRVPVTYPDLGCTGFLEPVNASAGEEMQDGFRETITEGTCDNGGTWHLAINDSRERATYNAPTGRYHAEGPLNRSG
ncbi:hypothetical protein CAFEA_01455 [Corynebacterium afermentans subsp. afermentans]|uniref:Uncharacterized protein n=1 Tax=Corynebacterium afermentans TaxID=38286 RepID=A0A9X8R3A1_9CORY|nr:hypothetical protein [Corynebacterium afermentans]OAA16810.1 hypothetical protein Caferm_06085 [Corynebacterium afermentans subsp. afermentans]WJY55918.1 hypothetical protein CAFEA_01455 [Corynebacterium afermentans subsp. afermentans]SIQ20935.1 hypothetical protein SAMN05421802_10894 [Corynebacterium afermentans]